MSLELLDLSGGEDGTHYGGQDNRHKFTGGIPSEWGALTNLKELKMPNSGLDGKRSAPILSGFAFSLTLHLLAGELPKQLPTSLEVLTFGEYSDDTSEFTGGIHPNKFTGGIPFEWGALTNLKSLKIVACGLDGKPLSIRTERFDFADIFYLSVTWCACTGELPLEIIRMKAKGVTVKLAGNTGFTLPSNIGELGDDITQLDLSNCSLTGLLSIRTEHLHLFCDNSSFR